MCSQGRSPEISPITAWAPRSQAQRANSTQQMCFLTRFPVHIYFTPTLEGEVNFNLICDVKKKSQPLYLNVKAIGHTMNVSVKCEESHGVVTELNPEHPKQIHFREVRGP